MSRWYKCDLQVASPSGGFALHGADLQSPTGRQRAAEEYVQHIKSAGIEVFAVTDHNDMKMQDEIRSAARDAGLTMFPGMELSTGTGSDGVHLLLLGDPDADIVELKAGWYHAAGYDHPDSPPFLNGKHLPSHLSLTSILDGLPEQSIAIAPHALTDNGIANKRTVRDQIRWRSLHHDRLAAIDVGRPGDSERWNGKFRNRELNDFPFLKRMAFIATSDAYKVADLGEYTWIRMDRPNLECLRQALLDYEARVFCHWELRLGSGDDPNEVRHAHIDSINLVGITTSREPLTLTFDPRINVIIGGRGSGKSTVVQAIRAVYDPDAKLPPAIEDETKRYRDGVLKPGGIESAYTQSLSHEHGVVTWNHSSGTKSDSDAPVIGVHVVSQKELFERTSADFGRGEEGAIRLMALVDEALEDAEIASELLALGIDVTGVRADVFDLTLQESRSRYAQAVATRTEAQDRLKGRSTVMKNLQSLKLKINTLDDEGQRERLKVADDSIGDAEKMNDYMAGLDSWTAEVQRRTLPALPAFSSREAEQAFAPLRDLTAQLHSRVTEIATAVDTTVEAVKEAIADHAGAFTKVLASARQTKQEYETRLRDMGVDLSQYSSLKAEQKAAEGELTKLNLLDQQLPAYLLEEHEAWSALESLRRDRLKARSSFVDIISRRVKKLKLEVLEGAGANLWKQEAHRIFGFRAGGHLDALDQLAHWIWDRSIPKPEREQRGLQWRDSLLANDYADIAVSLPAAFLSRVASLPLATRIELATRPADDVLEMSFLKLGADPTKAESWQSVSAGSPGQRSAAMLAFMLSYGVAPLVLDQPEDDLDSRLVTDLVVTGFRDARWKRQLIVVTHEANIPVNTDAERVIVLENVDGSLRVVSSDAGRHEGPIDNKNVRQDIQDLLEGGVSAFVNRERRYDNELSHYRNDLRAVAEKYDSAQLT